MNNTLNQRAAPPRIAGKVKKKKNSVSSRPERQVSGIRSGRDETQASYCHYNQLGDRSSLRSGGPDWRKIIAVAFILAIIITIDTAVNNKVAGCGLILNSGRVEYLLGLYLSCTQPVCVIASSANMKNSKNAFQWSWFIL